MPPLTWTTTQAPPGRQFEQWRELICSAFLALTPESDLRDGLAGTVTQWPLGALNLARIESQRQSVFRTEADIARTPHPGFYANMQVKGVSQMTQGSRSTILRPGDLAVVATTEPFRFDFGSDFRQLSFFVPAPLLPGPVRTATRLDTAQGVGAAVRHAVGALIATPMSSRTATRLAMTAGGLLAIALEPAAEPVITRSPHTYEAAVEDIEEHLTDEGLAPSATAARLGISVRRLHGLFAGKERSYAATVRRFRLERARRELADPARAHLRVIDVAVEAGFVNVAAFHRAFRREFGLTPAQARLSTGASAERR